MALFDRKTICCLLLIKYDDLMFIYLVSDRRGLSLDSSLRLFSRYPDNFDLDLDSLCRLLVRGIWKDSFFFL